MHIFVHWCISYLGLTTDNRNVVWRPDLETKLFKSKTETDTKFGFGFVLWHWTRTCSSCSLSVVVLSVLLCMVNSKVIGQRICEDLSAFYLGTADNRYCACSYSTARRCPTTAD